MTVSITRITATSPDRPGTPTLIATFDVDLPQALLRNCKLLERQDGDCFVLPPAGLKFWDEAIGLRASICEAALDALDDIDA
ncbi:MAG TPA: hypothetical protein VHC94_19135 [Nitrobacter sp.]|nr:hypothetical protein [Nitrobacter sp.]